MSYTLTGRIESRLVAAAPALLLALAVHRWWAIELVALMLAVGLALDVLVYDRGLPYQPGWLAVPIGVLELILVYAGMDILGIGAPLRLALVIYAVGWVSAQLFGHALFPRVELSYAERGGELGNGGLLTASAVVVTVLVGLVGAYVVRAPTVHLHGVVQGPIVIRHAETLVGGIVRGGIVIRADHVTLRHVTVVGGETGIDVQHAQHVVLDHVRVLQSTLDAIHVVDGAVMINNCSISSPGSQWVQGIEISYSMGRPTSMISGCTIAGVREGITTHSSMVDVMDNHVVDTTMRGISLAEMSMDMASGNVVESANGIAIVCMDHSICEIKHNTIAGARVDPTGNPMRNGIAIESFYYAEAEVGHNTIVASPGGVRAFDNSTITR
jgi:hypothetical protein